MQSPLLLFPNEGPTLAEKSRLFSSRAANPPSRLPPSSSTTRDQPPSLRPLPPPIVHGSRSTEHPSAWYREMSTERLRLHALRVSHATAEQRRAGDGRPETLMQQILASSWEAESEIHPVSADTNTGCCRQRPLLLLRTRSPAIESGGFDGARTWFRGAGEDKGLGGGLRRWGRFKRTGVAQRLVATDSETEDARERYVERIKASMMGLSECGASDCCGCSQCVRGDLTKKEEDEGGEEGWEKCEDGSGWATDDAEDAPVLQKTGKKAKKTRFWFCFRR